LSERVNGERERSEDGEWKLGGGGRIGFIYF